MLSHVSPTYIYVWPFCSFAKTLWLKMTGFCTGGPSSMHKLPQGSMVVASSLSLFLLPVYQKGKLHQQRRSTQALPSFFSTTISSLLWSKMWSVWIPKSHSNFTRSGFFYPVACEQALHLRDIVKSRRARDTCVARLASLAQIGELARSLFIRWMVIPGFAALQIQKFFAYKDSSGELEQPCRVSSFYTGFLPFSA